MSQAWIKYAVERQAEKGDVEIVGLMDISLEAAKGKAEKFNLGAECFTDLTQAIKTTGANVVFDITIPDSHKDVTLTALSLGCSVFGEKPMASSLEDARSMTAKAHALGLQYSVMQNRRYLKQIRAYRKLISQRLGNVGIVNADFYIGAHFGGFRDAMESPLVLDMAIHTFDMARFISGGDPVSVYCQEFIPSWSWYKGACSATCVFKMANGAIFTYRGSWSAEGAHTSWESDWRVAGDHGTAIWNGKDVPYADIVVPPPAGEKQPFNNQFERVEAVVDWVGREGHNGCIDEMFAALAEKRPAETDCGDNLKSVQMVFGALESSRTGKVVSLK